MEALEFEEQQRGHVCSAAATSFDAATEDAKDGVPGAAVIGHAAEYAVFAAAAAGLIQNDHR